MELTHTFTVPASVEETWSAFADIRSVAECFPGATVTTVEGDDFSGSCKVKLGPIALVYNGSGTFVEKDESAHRFVVEAKGKDKRGNGTAGATVTATFTAAGDSTDVAVLTDLSITGKPAQFGRGVIQDVSDKLLQQFVDCLEAKVVGPSAPVAAAAGETSAAAAASAAALAAGGDEAGGRSQPADVAAGQLDDAAAAAASGVPGVTAGVGTPTGGRVPVEEADDALDLGATVLPVLARTYWKQALAILLTLIALRRLLSRRH